MTVTDRQGSQDSTEGPREKETKLADYSQNSHNNIIFFSRYSLQLGHQGHTHDFSRRGGLFSFQGRV